MRKLLRPRRRLLLLTADAGLRTQLQAILSGMGFWVDYESELGLALDRFKHYRHPVVFVDERCLPRNSARLFAAFYGIQQNGVVVTLVEPHNKDSVFTYLADGAWDIIELPLHPEEVVTKVQRMVRHYKLIGSHNFLQYLVLFFALLVPLVLLAVRIIK
jgi:DNA-binding NtrC family response regulator